MALKDSSGFIVRHASGVFKMKYCRAKTQNKNQTYKDQGFQGTQTGCLGDSALGTEPNGAQ